MPWSTVRHGMGLALRGFGLVPRSYTGDQAGASRGESGALRWRSRKCPNARGAAAATGRGVVPCARHVAGPPKLVVLSM
jgi:hypothetical protein